MFPDETPDEMSLPPTSLPADSSDIHGLAWDATLYYVLGMMSLAVAAFGNLILVRFGTWIVVVGRLRFIFQL